MSLLLYKLELVDPSTEGMTDEELTDEIEEDLEMLAEHGWVERLVGPLRQQDGSVKWVALFAVDPAALLHLEIDQYLGLHMSVVSTRWYAAKELPAGGELRDVWDAARE